VLRGQVEFAAPLVFAGPGVEQVGRARLYRAIKVELDRVRIQPLGPVEMALTRKQLPAPLDREDIVLPADRGFDPQGEFTGFVERLQRVETVFANVQVLGRHHATRGLEPGAVAVGSAQHLMRGWRHSTMDQCVGTVDHQPERFTGDAIAFEIAVGRVGGVGGDPSQLQGLRIDHHRPPGAVQNGHGAVGHEAVQPGLARLQPGLLEGVAHEILTVDPAGARVALGIVKDRLPDLIRRRVFEADVHVVGVLWAQREVGVGVHVVKAGHGKFAIEVDHLSPISGQWQNVFVRTDGDEYPILDRNGLGPGAMLIDRVDPRIVQDQIRRAGAVSAVAGGVVIDPCHQITSRGLKRDKGLVGG